MKHSALTLLILQLNSLLDSGRYDDIGVDEVKAHIRDGSVLRFLKQRAGADIDLSIHLDTATYGDFERFYVGYLQALLNAYAGDERRKWGVENRGVCLLIAWTNEIIQQGKGWLPNPDVAIDPDFQTH